MDELVELHLPTILALLGPDLARQHNRLILKILDRVAVAIRKKELTIENKHRFMRAQIAVLDLELLQDLLAKVGTYDQTSDYEIEEAANSVCHSLENWGICIAYMEPMQLRG